MKKLLFLSYLLLANLGIQAQCANEAFGQWKDNKFSMFIHFGLYSELGGVWNGKPVTKGYSEQIMKFASIPETEYRTLASGFNPIKFNADSIAELAKRAGMRSIVFTSKHHDGFCMFHTNTTEYNSYDVSPCKRDFVKEMSDACRRAGLNFGLYFSLIDWNHPDATPSSPDNVELITDKHHKLNKTQVEELLTRYGTISELWFDMGSNTPDKSRELYELVHKLQPGCMVSGRLGNDRYDFCVMGDNQYPESALQTPWQTAASMFDETWSYRSWQKRGKVEDKIKEKLKSLVGVVSHGGNFLLNIGPKGDGSVVEFEKKTLEGIGEWLKKYGYAIYGCDPTPFSETFSWGNITRKGKYLYLFLSGDYPTDGKIKLNMPGYTLMKANGRITGYRQNGNRIVLTVPATEYKDGTIRVITLEFDKDICELPGKVVKEATLTSQNARPLYSYSCFDYYSNYRSCTGYEWNTGRKLPGRLELVFTPQEKGREIDIDIDGKIYTLKLDKGKVKKNPPLPGTQWGDIWLCGPGSNEFNAPSTLNTDPDNSPINGKKWIKTEHEEGEIACKELETYFIMRDIKSPEQQQVIAEIGAGNGVEIYLNGKSVMKHLNPYKCKYRKELVVLPLQKGDNQLVIRLYNRFENKLKYLIRPANDTTTLHQIFNVPEIQNGKSHTITVRPHNPASPHADAELSNLQIKL